MRKESKTGRRIHIHKGMMPRLNSEEKERKGKERVRPCSDGERRLFCRAGLHRVGDGRRHHRLAATLSVGPPVVPQLGNVLVDGLVDRMVRRGRDLVLNHLGLC
jgi:hypothetical protein